MAVLCNTQPSETSGELGAEGEEEEEQEEKGHTVFSPCHLQCEGWDGALCPSLSQMQKSQEHSGSMKMRWEANSLRLWDTKPQPINAAEHHGQHDSLCAANVILRGLQPALQWSPPHSTTPVNWLQTTSVTQEKGRQSQQLFC